MWRKLSRDGWAIAAGVFLSLGVIFALVGIPLTISLAGIFVGLGFVGLGGLFLAAGIPILVWRYNEAQQTLNVLRMGEATLGKIVDVYENYHVTVNGRHPWTISYRFQLGGRECEGKTRTLRTPGLSHQAGQPVHVLYLEDDPRRNTIYPPVM